MQKSIMSATCCLKCRFRKDRQQTKFTLVFLVNHSSDVARFESRLLEKFSSRATESSNHCGNYRNRDVNQQAVLSDSDCLLCRITGVPLGHLHHEVRLTLSRAPSFAKSMVDQEPSFISAGGRGSPPCACMSTGPTSCRNHSRSSSRSLPATVVTGAKDREITHVLHKAFHCMTRHTQDFQ